MAGFAGPGAFSEIFAPELVVQPHVARAPTAFGGNGWRTTSGQAVIQKIYEYQAKNYDRYPLLFLKFSSGREAAAALRAAGVRRWRRQCRTRQHVRHRRHLFTKNGLAKFTGYIFQSRQVYEQDYYSKGDFRLMVFRIPNKREKVVSAEGTEPLWRTYYNDVPLRERCRRFLRGLAQ